MSKAAVQAPGLRALQRDLRRWADQASNLAAANAAAGRVVAAAAAAATAPRRTGRLAGSFTSRPVPGGAVVESSAPYAVPVSEHHPFAMKAARATEPLWLAAYVADVDRATARMAGKTY